MPGIFYGYLNRAPGRPMDPAVNEALHFILAQEGQAILADVGLLPGPAEQMNIFGEFKLY
jgi:phosphate transport system substrate-binding protein